MSNGGTDTSRDESLLSTMKEVMSVNIPVR
jgi:hypothetical protein